MFTIPDITSSPDKPALYSELRARVRALFEGERNFLANAANCASMLFHTLPDLNWAGFYFLEGDDLVLGPFQGKPACVRIPLGRGVCGHAARSRQALVVPDVYAFPGHIACDAASRSEVVVPLLQGGRVLGVLDLDSPSPGRFDDVDAEGLRAIAAELLTASNLAALG